MLDLCNALVVVVASLTDALCDGRAIVFVVDSSIFQKEVKDVAEFLYSLLTDSVVMQNAPNMLIACNKQGMLSVSSLL